MIGRLKRVPLVPLKGLAITPGMIVHFDINNKGAIRAIEKAMMQKKQDVFLCMMKNPNTGAISTEDLYSVGTIAVIRQVIKLPNNVVRVLVEGVDRAELSDIDTEDEEGMLFAAIRPVIDDEPEDMLNDQSDPEKVALVQSFMEKMREYVKLDAKMEKSLSKVSVEKMSFSRLMDLYAAHMPLSCYDRQTLLDNTDVSERAISFCVILENHIKVQTVRNEVQTEVKERVDKNQKEYILREQLKFIKEELGENKSKSDEDSYIEQVDKLNASDEIKEKIKKEIDRFSQMSVYSSESGVVRAYIETLLEMPWDNVSVDNNNLDNAESVLEADHYGLKKVKERMLEFLAVRTLTKKGESPIVCLVGPPGTGKTSIAKSVARALDKKYERICLGGVRDEAEIRGHRKTYVGAMPGRVAMALKDAGVKNPLILLDEIDKMSSDFRGDTASALLEVLDAEQNTKFRDHYIELPIDLSEVLFIATANSLSDIPKPLLDRLEIIEVSSYTENEKVHIAKEHLVKKQIEKNGLKDSQLTFTEDALWSIVRGYTKEAGVRNLERKIGEICRKVAKKVVKDSKLKVTINKDCLEEYLGKERFHLNEANEENEIGIVRGLAWTSVGGDTLEIEVNIMPGKGEILLTGQLGDVMKESAQTGISFIRSISEEHGISKDFFKENDFHIHIPEGAVPKDGPSAGITMATAMYSAIVNVPVRADVAMTGEITLRGRVLPIGGLKEKTLAAKNAGIKRILVPVKNMKDIEEIEEEIKEGLEIIYVENMSQVLDNSLVKVD